MNKNKENLKMTKYALTGINPNLKMNVQKNGYSREYLNKVREANGLPAKNKKEIK